MFTHVILSVREGFPKEETWMSAATHVLRFEKLVAFVTWNFEGLFGGRVTAIELRS